MNERRYRRGGKERDKRIESKKRQRGVCDKE
jgi:hypothetical protein